MRRIYIILGVLLFTQAVILFDEQLYKQFRAIDDDKFGSSLIDALELHLRTTEPIQKFIDSMRKLEDQFQQEQKADDVGNNKFQDQCQTDLGILDTDNALLQTRIVEIQSLIDDITPQLTQIQGELKAKEAWKKELDGKIKEIEDQRKAEKELHEQRMKEHEWAQYVISTVKLMFTKDENAITFLQTNKNPASEDTLDLAIDHLNKSIIESQLVQKKSYERYFNILIQIAEGMKTQEDPNLVIRIVQLCEKLLKNIEDSGQLDRKVDQKREISYQNIKKLMMKDLQLVNAKISSLQADLVSLTDRLTNAQRDMTDYFERQQQKQKQVDDRSKECAEHGFLYQQARDRRMSNKVLVSQIIGLFSGNERDFAAYVKLRKDAGDYD